MGPLLILLIAWAIFTAGALWLAIAAYHSDDWGYIGVIAVVAGWLTGSAVFGLVAVGYGLVKFF